jgi:hypothetical protein
MLEPERIRFWGPAPAACRLPTWLIAVAYRCGFFWQINVDLQAAPMKVGLGVGESVLTCGTISSNNTPFPWVFISGAEPCPAREFFCQT